MRWPIHGIRACGGILAEVFGPLLDEHNTWEHPVVYDRVRLPRKDGLPILFRTGCTHVSSF